jgi:hypothetical protein
VPVAAGRDGLDVPAWACATEGLEGLPELGVHRVRQV